MTTLALYSSLSTSRSIKALKIGQRFYERSFNYAQGRIQSCFAKVVNIVTDEELLALALPEAGGSSRFLTVDTIPSLDVLDAGQACRFTPTTFYVGNFAIDISKVLLWRSTLLGLKRSPDNRFILDAGQAKHFLSLICDMDIRPGADAGLEIAPETLKRWVGLGPGLTPSGDDVLLGYLAICNEFGEFTGRQKAFQEALYANLHRTTLLSAQILRSAISRDYHENIEALIAVLAGQSTRSLESCLRVLLGVGAHSGGDTAYGMALALAYLNKTHK